MASLAPLLHFSSPAASDCSRPSLGRVERAHPRPEAPMMQQPAPSPLLTKNREVLLTQQLQLERRQLERLKHDFTYNLQLLKERDAELEQYDVEVSAMRAELEQRDARARDSKRAADEAAAKLAGADDRVAALDAATAESERQK
eukprot:4368292-Prymnesium_polylepis.1